MKLPSRGATDVALPGTTGTARVDRRIRSLLPRLGPGDIAVLDHVDLDRATAQRIADSGVRAVVNASPFVSGRYPNQGPAILLDVGIELVEDIGTDGLARVRDGRAVRLLDGVLHDGELELAHGRVLDRERLATELELARGGLVTQLTNFTHNSTEFLRREQDLLLHGRGAPRLGARLAGRPVVVVVAGPDHGDELAGIKGYLREQHPVLIAVDDGADALLAAGHKPDVVVVSSPLVADAGRVSARALRGARDVVVVVDRGDGKTPLDALERLGVRPLRFETAASPEDAALMLAWLGDASLIVGVGGHADLDDFLDRQRAALASTFLTRLKVGPRLVDARSVPELYAGRVRSWQLWLLLLAGVLAVLASLAVTPVGQEWLDELRPALASLADRLGGLLP
ncbi:putative cytokinetic ring protein SteA [Nocardioides donggukensis]|uniref:SteA-like C-terminal domain-containing protein n=1 Tax=Nocardioides donggukensis TaxID=2774019 RepID=A0A927K7K9_9ACTN|nr:putative cytokinetic ring protein SteA [Nocardioides donggukensis]MBD8869276.1 hypothetical protein [Nocardioides donggukensis]